MTGDVWLGNLLSQGRGKTFLRESLHTYCVVSAGAWGLSHKAEAAKSKGSQSDPTMNLALLWAPLLGSAEGDTNCRGFQFAH